jgi:competence protein ComEC
VAAGLAGAPVWGALLAAGLLLLAPRQASGRPAGRLAPVLIVTLGGGIASGATHLAREALCPAPVFGAPVVVEGRLLASPRTGSAPLERADGCGVVTVVVPEAHGNVSAGRLVGVEGRWRSGRIRPWLRADGVAVLEGPGAASRPVLGWRDALVERLDNLYGEHGPMVAALVLARREGLDPEVRSAFADAGIAHLLAISGFHVGLVAGLVWSLVRALGRGRPAAAVAAAIVAWGYVGFIGFPAAACRAALILTVVAAARMRGYPASRWGPLATAALLLLLQDPALLASAGFQLSFAGAAGLVAWAGALDRAFLGGIRSLEYRVGSRLPLPAGLRSGLAAGIAATLATLPIVAWHFGRVSLVGIPMTLLATPLVVVALPGALLTLALHFLLPGPAHVLAGGVSLLLKALTLVTVQAAALPWAAVWVDRPTVVAACVGTVLALMHARSPRIGASGRRRLAVVYAAAGLLAWPLLVYLEGQGRMELLAIDVGQGDAIALRTPRGRWWLVDAGPPPRGDGGGHPVVRALRARGVRALHTLVLTHPDADHIGGAEAVLEHVTPGRIIDPMLPAPKAAYADLLERAHRQGVPWFPARAGNRYEVDGVVLDVLHPRVLPEDPAEGNAASVVLLVSWRGFSALLTGDAYVDVERAVAPRVGDVDVLKVGHHGSETSTDSTFLAAVRPEVAIVSAGRGNRYGHPAPPVLSRLEAAGAEVRRTDVEGTVRIVVHRDGTFAVSSGRWAGG